MRSLSPANVFKANQERYSVGHENLAGDPTEASMLAGGHNPMSFPWFHSPSKEQILGAFDTPIYYDLI